MTAKVPMWPKVQIGDVIKFFDFKRVPLNSRERGIRQGAYPYYGASGIVDYIDDYIFDGRYLLVSEDGENLNSRQTPIAFFATGKFWVNNHAHIVRAIPDKADDWFLKAWFAQANIAGYITGAAQPKLSQENLRRIELRLPPLSTQKKIAAVFSAYDDLIENNEKRIKILEDMAQNLYREWFVKFRFPSHAKVKMVDSPLGKIPQGWEVKRVGELCILMQSGGTPSRTKPEFWDNGNIDWYKTRELWDDFLFSSEEKITKEGLGKSSARLYESGTILMAIYGSPTVGRLGILTRQATCNQAALGMRANPRLASQPFLFYTLFELREYFNRIAQGAAQQNISKAKVDEAPCILPPLTLIEHFTNQTLPIWGLLENIQKKNKALRQTLDLLLPKLISGEVDVSELEIKLPETAA